MNCDVCGEKIRIKKTPDGNLFHFYYRSANTNTYIHAFADYDRKPLYTGIKSKEDIMVCSKCYSKNENTVNAYEIKNPGYISEGQFKDFAILKLREGK